MKKRQEQAKKWLIERILVGKIQNRKQLDKEKRKASSRFQIDLVSNIDLLATYHELLKKKIIPRSILIEKLLITKPIRSLSGIVNVSVLTSPHPGWAKGIKNPSCPARCIFCPTDPSFPKSYLAGEPAADRAKAQNFDPYLQVEKRLESLKAQGHPIDKIELRIVGGTWSFYPKRYQTWFIKRCFQASNEFQAKKTKQKQTLAQVQRKNQKAKSRIVGLSIETRPDFINPKEILRLRRLGVTLVELGVQTVFDDVHEKCKTGTIRQKISNASRLLKDAGFKVLYQMMVNLPGSDPQKDLRSFQTIFQDQNFKPDWLKIYPCLVCPQTKLYQLWKQGKYRPYQEQELVDLLIEIKQELPYWVRLTRIFRDVPAQTIVTGSKTSNIRQVLERELKKRKLKCRCIRCREVKQDYDPKEKPYLFRQDYQSSQGKEVFLTFENKQRTKLFSLLRLRLPSQYLFPVLRNSSLIREVQTFGSQLSLEKTDKDARSPQHKGLGKKLIDQAEKITKQEFGLKRVAVISGVGVREYYKKLGYRLKDTYMVKKLD
jgi:elongator complex protein 3